jgi:hypothetical protein
VTAKLPFQLDAGVAEHDVDRRAAFLCVAQVGEVPLRGVNDLRLDLV